MSGFIKPTVKLGDMDLTSGGQVTLAGFNIYEDILNPYGPMAEIRVIDPSDKLGQSNLNGSFDKDVEISLRPDSNFGSFGGNGKFKLKLFQNKNMNDHSISGQGSGKFKQYDVRCVSEEVLNAQGNHVEKSFSGKKTGDVVEHILKKGFKTKKQIEKGETETRSKVRIPKMHPLKALHMMNTEHVSSKYESSCFVTFQQGSQGGEHKYVFKTFEELFEQSPTVKLKQSTQLDYNSGGQEKQNSIIWFKASDSFFSGTRALSKSSEYTFDLTTHKVVASNQQKQNKFKFADNNEIYNQAPSYVDKGVPTRYIHDKANNKEKHKTSEAKTKRADFLAKLSQTSAQLEVYYNPKITLGSMIEIEIPQKSDKSQGGEKQFNGKCLVVAIRTKYKISKEPPNCTMILRVVKGNSYKSSGGGGNG